jgi:hypothetical protein
MTCPAYTATQANDLDAKQRLLEQWRVEYNSPEMDLSAVTCDGCISKARLGGYCGACPVRACGVERGVLNCAYCPDYGCEKLEGFFTAAPQVRSQLEALRAQIKAN